ncbi:MAG: hypothetical protein IT457_05375 [Planctomycetes bacterium]|nr:hypothetical protein [Planctomycetota bacterium]
MTTIDVPPPKLLFSAGRRLHRRMATLSWPDPVLPTPRAADVHLATAFIDVLVFSLGFVEVLRLRRVADWHQLDAVTDVEQLLAELRATTGLTVDEAESAVSLLVHRLRAVDVQWPASQHRPDSLPIIEAQVLHGAGEFLRSFPVKEVCDLARSMHLTENAHRIQSGAEQAQAIYNRLHAPASEQFHVAAVAYANGSIELDVAAKLLGLGRADLIAAFEAHGFSRSPAAIELDHAHRTAILARIRRERLERSGNAQPDPGLVVRDVIASQRIEGVDARRWLPR